MMNVKVVIYDGVKYDKTSQKVNEVIYNNVVSYEVKEISDKELFALGYDETDENSEYLILSFADGEKGTFRNSHVDLFRA